MKLNNRITKTSSLEDTMRTVSSQFFLPKWWVLPAAPAFLDVKTFTPSEKPACGLNVALTTRTTLQKKSTHVTRHFNFLDWWGRVVLIGVALSWLGATPHALATCQEGCDITNANTFLGDDALISNAGGFYDTAVGVQALYSNTTGAQNTASGVFALNSNTTGNDNTATGVAALFFNTTGSENTASGVYALNSNTAGTDNTATGVYALFSNTTGNNNTASGYFALAENTTGSNNTASGDNTLSSNTIGGSNTASGYDALYFNTNGNFNTAYGRGSLYQNTTASNNTAIGYHALNSNKTGTENTATGVGALQQSTANYNTAIGYQALNKTNTGHDNTAIGHDALQNNTNGYSNVALGQYALQSNTGGFNNIAVGGLAGFNITTGSNNIDIGNQGLGFESNVIRIGTPGTHTAALISGIYNVPVSGLGVVIGSSGQLGTTASSARYKENIRPMDKASEAILSLQPVTFRYRKALDPQAIPQFGLVAEQVQKVNPNLVARDEQGKPYSVRYEAVNAMLLNEFIKAHRKMEEQSQEIATQKTTIGRLETAMAQKQKDFAATAAQQEKEIKALAAGLQKVGNQLQLSKHVARVVANDQ